MTWLCVLLRDGPGAVLEKATAAYYIIEIMSLF